MAARPSNIQSKSWIHLTLPEKAGEYIIIKWEWFFTLLEKIVIVVQAVKINIAPGSQWYANKFKIFNMAKAASIRVISKIIWAGHF